jgi:WD40 repeat protein
MRNIPSALVYFTSQDSTNVSLLSSQLYNLLCMKMTKKKLLVAFAGSDKYIHIWDTKENKVIKKLESSDSTINEMILLRDGSLVSVSDDSQVRIWDLRHFTLISTLRGHTAYVRCVLELPDGRIATGAHDCTVRLWNTKETTCLNVLVSHDDAVLGLVLLDKDHFASGGGQGDCNICIWNIATLSVVRSFSNQESCCCLLKLQNGNIASGSDTDGIRVWDWTTGTLLSVLAHEKDQQIIWNMDNLDGNLLVSCGQKKSIVIWNINTKKVVTFITDENECRSVMRLDQNRIVGCLDTAMCVWSNYNCTLEKSYACNFAIWCVLVL